MSDAPTPMKPAATGQWWVQVRGKAYGPYSMEQLQGFVVEGRVRSATRVTNAPDGAWVEARRVVGLIAPQRANEPANDAGVEGANVIVYAEIVTGAWHNFMAALQSMGYVCDLGPGLWLVRTRFTSGVIRNALSQTLERGDRFVVIDATRDRLAWFGLGPEADVKIGRVWNGPLRNEKAS